MSSKNIVLIGMPGAGKSTVGVLLAKRLGLDFIDTDLLIQNRRGLRLQQIIDSEGLDTFLRLEEEVLLGLRAKGAVVATGGSAVYTESGMAALKRNGTVVFLHVPLATLKERIRDIDSRGLAVEPGETLADLYRRRLPLYQRHADLKVDGTGKSMEEMAAAIAAALEKEEGKS